tara:strand:- start:641 stop:910 length:270 start_codon:yes stop_codon:yes gene_type:complete
MSNKCIKCKDKYPDEAWYKNSSHIEFYSRYLGYCGSKCYHKELPEKRNKRAWGAILHGIWSKYDQKPKTLRELSKSHNLKLNNTEKINI